MPSHTAYIGMMELTDRLAPLVPENCFLTPRSYYTERPMGFGRVTVTVEMSLNGPNREDVTDIRVTRTSKEEVLKALEGWLRQ